MKCLEDKVGLRGWCSRPPCFLLLESSGLTAVCASRLFSLSFGGAVCSVRADRRRRREKGTKKERKKREKRKERTQETKNEQPERNAKRKPTPGPLLFFGFFFSSLLAAGDYETRRSRRSMSDDEFFDLAGINAWPALIGELGKLDVGGGQKKILFVDRGSYGGRDPSDVVIVCPRWQQIEMPPLLFGRP